MHPKEGLRKIQKMADVDLFSRSQRPKYVILYTLNMITWEEIGLEYRKIGILSKVLYRY